MNNDSPLIARELLRRRHARESLEGFCRSIDIPGAPLRGDPECDQFKPVEQVMALHHVLVCRHIQRTMTTPRGRGMILGPPGMAKSTYASVMGPSWHAGKFPGKPLLVTGYDSKIAEKQSRKVRQIARDPLYSCIWEERPLLLDDQRSISDWALSNGSGYCAAGILSGITGNRFWGIVADDLVRNREDADSKTVMDKTIDEFNDTLLTRLLPGGWLLLINTRWSEIDVSASILPDDYACQSGLIKCKDGQMWDVLCLQAECERADDPLGRKPGEFLWPEWFPREHWSQWRENPRAQRTWSALFQQRPAPPEGIVFKRDMFKRFDLNKPPGTEGALPAGTLRKYGASDYAVTDPSDSSTGDPDYTEHGVGAIAPDGMLYLIDWWFRQCETDKGIEAFIAMLRRHKPVLRWAHEGGVIDKAIRPAIRRAMRETRTWVSLEPMPSIQDKMLKLTSFHARAAGGMVAVPNTPWGDRLIDLLCSFPTAKHDDGPDVCGLLGRMIDKMQDSEPPPVDRREPDLIPFTEAWLEWRDRNAKPKVRFV